MVHTSSSIGIALSRTMAQPPRPLLKAADMAMYHAKENERGTFCFFSSELNTRAVERLELDNRLRDAVLRHEFEVLLLPQWSLGDRPLNGVEALARWRCDGEWISRHASFHRAEENGQIIPLGAWIMRGLPRCSRLARTRPRDHGCRQRLAHPVRRDDLVNRVSKPGRRPACLPMRWSWKSPNR